MTHTERQKLLNRLADCEKRWQSATRRLMKITTEREIILKEQAYLNAALAADEEKE